MGLELPQTLARGREGSARDACLPWAQAEHLFRFAPLRTPSGLGVLVERQDLVLEEGLVAAGTSYLVRHLPADREQDAARWDEALDYCRTRCQGCPRCRFVSISLRNRECSWFQDCDTLRLETAPPGYRTFAAIGATPPHAHLYFTNTHTLHIYAAITITVTVAIPMPTTESR